MRCPNGDGDLIHHDITSSGLSTPYDHCPTCGGFWLSSFSANHIDSTRLPKVPVKSVHVREVPVCPTCDSSLSRLRGESVPPGAIAYRCPDGDGFYFPARELAKYREASETRIRYHALWGLPLPALSHIILATLFIAISVTGLIAGLQGVRERQQTVSNAGGLIRTQQAIVGKGGTVLFAVTTTQETSVTVQIPTANILNKPLVTGDGYQHTITLTLPDGPHSYTYSLTVNNQTITSSVYTIRIP